jgi:hypothetical protein
MYTYHSHPQTQMPPPSSDSDYSSHPVTEKHYTTTTQPPNSVRTLRSSRRGRIDPSLAAQRCARSLG